MMCFVTSIRSRRWTILSTSLCTRDFECWRKECSLTLTKHSHQTKGRTTNFDCTASIVSMYLHQTGSHVGLVVTFGGPRFTTNEGARKYQVLNQATYRVVRCDDAIAFLPPPNFFGWTNDSYQGNGNILLLLRPPNFDYSQGIDIERDF